MWRSVQCTYCGVLVSKTETTVNRESYRLALQRQRAQAAQLSEVLTCNQQSFVLRRTLLTLVDGTRYVLAQRVGATPIQVLLRIGEKSKYSRILQEEAITLRYFHSLKGALAGHYSRIIPAAIEVGDAEGRYADQAVLVLSLIPGVWGSLSSVVARHPEGIDARHVVWMWRRLLDILSYVHSVGWSLNSINPETAWLNPQDHGVFVMDWSRAKSNAKEQEKVLDIQHSARLIQVMLSGTTERSFDSIHAPIEIKRLLATASEDRAFCERHQAKGIDEMLVKTAQQVFGPPKFIEFQT